MQDICPAAQKRRRTLARETADEFESTILATRVHEQIDGQHSSHDDLAWILDLAEETYDFARLRGHDEKIFEAAETLNDRVEAIRDEIVAKACAVILTDDWTDVYNEQEMKEARTEARQWLQANLDAAERAGVAEMVLTDV